MTTTLGDNIRALRLQEGLTQDDLGKSLGVTRRTIERWETGETAMHESRLALLVSQYGISRDDILSEKHGLAARRFLHNAYRINPTSPENGNAEVSAPILKFMRRDSDIVLARAGNASLPSDVLARHPKSFFVKPLDNSMTLSYPRDALLLVDTKPTPWNGSTIVVIIDGAEPLIRRFQGGNDSMLLTANPQRGMYPDVAIDRRRARVLGVVVWYRASRDLLGY